MPAIVGTRVTQEQRHDAVKVPARVKREPPFLFTFHPFRWQFTDGEWTPILGKLRIDPGVNGVSDTGGTDLAVAGFMRRGWLVIQPSDERLGEFKNYSQRLPHARGGSSHMDVFITCEIEAGRLFITEGGAEYKRFLRHLVTSGIVPAISDNIKALKLAEQRSAVERLEGRLAVNPSNQVAAGKLTVARKRLEAMQAGSKPPAAPKPKRGPGRPKKTLEAPKDE